MIGRKPMPTGKPATRDPRRDQVLKIPPLDGELQTQLEQRVNGNMASNAGPTPGGYQQQSAPGMLPK